MVCTIEGKAFGKIRSGDLEGHENIKAVIIHDLSMQLSGYNPTLSWVRYPIIAN